MKGALVPEDRVVTRALHGTDYDYDEFVLPPHEHQEKRHFSISGDDVTYFMPLRDEADEFERLEDAWRWSDSCDWSHREGRSRPRIHITEPEGDQWFDYNLHGRDFPYDDFGWRSWARVCERQRIIDTIWSPPPKRGQHTMVEQTFPVVNWKQYGGDWWVTHGIGEHGCWKVPNSRQPFAGEDDAYYARQWKATPTEHVLPLPVPEGQLQLDVGEGGYVPWEPPVVTRQELKNDAFLYNYGGGLGPGAMDISYGKVKKSRAYDNPWAEQKTSYFRNAYKPTEYFKYEQEYAIKFLSDDLPLDWPKWDELESES